MCRCPHEILTRALSCANTTLVDRVDLATPAIAVLSTGYRPLGSCSRAAGWSAATLCVGTCETCIGPLRMSVHRGEPDVSG